MVGRYYSTLISKVSSDIWYIATCEGKNDDGTYKMDHLMRIQNEKKSKWKHLLKPNLMNLLVNSILDCKIDGK